MHTVLRHKRSLINISKKVHKRNNKIPLVALQTKWTSEPAGEGQDIVEGKHLGRKQCNTNKEAGPSD